MPLDGLIVKRKPFLNRSETRTLDLLQRSLYGTGWEVYVKPRIADVLAAEEADRLQLADQNMLRFGHFDFVVINRSAGELADCAIEFDGPGHSTERQRERDRTKDRICLAGGLPLLRVSSEMIGEREQITILEWVMDRFIAHKTRRPYDEIIDGVFPAISDILWRLHDRFQIVPDSELLGVRPEEVTKRAGSWEEAALLLMYFPMDDSQLEHLDNDTYDLTMVGAEPHDYLFTISISRPYDDVDESRADEEPLLECRGRSPIPAQDPEMRELIERRLGTLVEDLDIYLAEYLVLTRVERWAERTLVPAGRY